MGKAEQFDIDQFLPYLLNQAAEQTGLEFQSIYKSRYGMLRAEWRVVFHLGKYGPMTATEIGQRALLHKTKTSRAVQALHDKRYLVRHTDASDRRQEQLQLTRSGLRVYEELVSAAKEYEQTIAAGLSKRELDSLKKLLGALIAS